MLVITPYLAEVLQHPQSIEIREGVLHIRDIEGPRRTGSVETRLEAMEQQVFKCQGMVECCSDPTSDGQVFLLMCHPWIGMLTHTILEDL